MSKSAAILFLASLASLAACKPDAQDPLVVVVNVREILETGNTTFNLRIENQEIPRFGVGRDGENAQEVASREIFRLGNFACREIVAVVGNGLRLCWCRDRCC